LRGSLWISGKAFSPQWGQAQAGVAISLLGGFPALTSYMHEQPGLTQWLSLLWVGVWTGDLLRSEFSSDPMVPNLMMSLQNRKFSLFSLWKHSNPERYNFPWVSQEKQVFKKSAMQN